jgi:hypothetical protein
MAGNNEQEAPRGVEWDANLSLKALTEQEACGDCLTVQNRSILHAQGCVNGCNNQGPFRS